jgi:hypothetical protein
MFEVRFLSPIQQLDSWHTTYTSIEWLHLALTYSIYLYSWCPSKHICTLVKQKVTDVFELLRFCADASGSTTFLIVTCEYTISPSDASVSFPGSIHLCVINTTCRTSILSTSLSCCNFHTRGTSPVSWTSQILNQIALAAAIGDRGDE